MRDRQDVSLAMSDTAKMSQIEAITLDLDDTLWPIAPVIQHAENCMHGWLSESFPEVAHRFPPQAMRALRDQVWLDHPALQHDFTAIRLISLRQAMLPFGAVEADVQAAFEVLFEARNQVSLFPNVIERLRELSERLPLVSISNGNADLKRIGLAPYFKLSLSARGMGIAKPDPRIFLAAATQLGIDPSKILHIGDHPEQDIVGAKSAGFKAAWIGEDATVFAPFAQCHHPDLIAVSLDALCARFF
jgi:FMN hydrolase / 5-amino-6-(5-phospho-D-ribitylamino)uracil phosphatase